MYGIVGSVRFVRSIILSLFDNCFYSGRIQREQDIDCEPAGWPIAEEGLNEGFIRALDSTSACLRKIDEVKTKRIKKILPQNCFISQYVSPGVSLCGTPTVMHVLFNFNIFSSSVNY